MQRIWTGLFVVSVVAIILIRYGQASSVSLEQSRDDATIRAFWFADDQEGWAVGDDGLILHTIDGGQTWERQASGTRANLRGVHFLSPFIGYVVGEEALPETSLTSGVLLMTRDGGATWRTASYKEMPGLYHIRFFDDRRGVVAGDACDAFPSGVWQTEDGGLTWRLVPQGRQTGWYAATWIRPDLGVFAGRWGKLAVWGQRAWQPVVGEWPANTALRSACWNGKNVWVCGDGGWLLRSSDSQLRRWERVPLPVQEELLQIWDFHALHFVGDFGWIAGRPGSVILHTWDNGKSWQVQATPQSLPIRALYFVNERCGWAGGDGGTILHTRDGGKTWRIQRRGVHRAAVLIVTARGENLPCELLANLAADQGFYTVAVRLFSEDANSYPEDAAAFAERFHATVRRLGGICGETLPSWPVSSVAWISSTEQLAKTLGNGQSARTWEALQRQLVLTLRVWKPDVIITDHPDPRGSSGAEGALVALAVSKAFRLAENADAFSEQLSHFRLEPWPANKLYACWHAADPATLSADWHVVRPTLGTTVWQATWPARHLLNPLGDVRSTRPTSSPESRGLGSQYFRLLDSRLEDAAQHRWIMDGIHAPAGGPTRREMPKLPADDAGFSQARAQAKKLQELLSLSERMLGSPQSAQRWLASIPEELATLSDNQRAELLWSWAKQLAQQGQWGLTQRLLIHLLESCPDHPLAPPAAQWLAAFMASGEARRRAELRHFHSELSQPDKSTSVSAQPSGRLQKPGLPPTPRNEPVTILQARRQEWQEWDRGALLAGDILAAYGPLWWLEPKVQFCLLAAQRHLGRHSETLASYTRFQTHWLRGPWYEAALTELAFLQSVRGALPKGETPLEPPAQRKRAVLCSWTSQPPYLDGVLQDAVWQTVQPIPLFNALGQTSESFSTEARLAYDQRFLYIALHCRHPEGHQRDAVRPRRRDDDLRPYDRVSILLDLDRDYVTCYHFQVDQRGCVNEECWGDPSWNPQWYVASRSTATAWEAEIAIPWSELVREPPNSRQVWAINLVRIIPNHGVQAASSPAGVVPRPEGMALLHFAQQN